MLSIRDVMWQRQRMFMLIQLQVCFIILFGIYPFLRTSLAS